jgi:hypothetical protein
MPKRKPKFRSAEAAKQARELEASWNKLMQKYPAQQIKPPTKIIDPVVRGPVGLPPVTVKTKKAKKLRLDAGSTAKPRDKKYTGTKMIGIGVLHKSNAVPVFSDEDAKDQAKMRR